LKFFIEICDCKRQRPNQVHNNGPVLVDIGNQNNPNRVQIFPNNPDANLNLHIHELQNMLNNMIVAQGNNQDQFENAQRMGTFVAVESMVKRWKRRFTAKDIDANSSC
jgi:hypothetical protein